jgi:hypothetical protein
VQRTLRTIEVPGVGGVNRRAVKLTVGEAFMKGEVLVTVNEVKTENI